MWNGVCVCVWVHACDAEMPFLRLDVVPDALERYRAGCARALTDVGRQGQCRFHLPAWLGAEFIGTRGEVAKEDRKM